MPRPVALLDELNPEQAEAVTWPGGPLLILAGAGSGKTRVLIYRVLHLAAERGVDPGNVLAVTFTNKAAGEMRQRLIAKIGDAGKRAWFHTFHGACLRMLRAQIEGRLKGFTRDFGIYDDDEQTKLMKVVMRRAGVSETLYTPRTILSRIHDAKNRMVGPERFKKEIVSFSDEAVAKVYPVYQSALRENNAVDFDDIILLAVQLLQEHRDVLAIYHSKFQHILVDEYQDTNKAQYTLVSLLASAQRNLACVGDDDQGIYAWRGADIQNILDFQKDYPDAKVVKLVRNYRSTKNILAAAMAIISKNRGRFGKELWTENPTGDRIRLYEAREEKDEARWIAEETLRLSSDGERKRADVAIFYRTNAQSRALEEAFRNKGMPYRLVGALRFFDRAEIKDVVAYLRASVNANDSLALQRILNVPPRGIGDTTVDHVTAFAESAQISFWDALTKAEKIDALKPAAKKKIAEFVEAMTELRDDAKQLPPAAFLRKAVERSGYLEWLANQSAAAESDDANARVDNVGELIQSATEFSAENPDATPATFLDQISLVSDVDDYDEKADAVTLMTFHAAKGLEFPVVFMTGMEEGIFPHMRALESDAGERSLEEERRLCYVGMTRARQRLYLTWVEERASWGARRPLGPSRFLAELPNDIVEPIRRAGDRFREAPASPRLRSFDDLDQRGGHDEFDQRSQWDDDAPASPPRAATGAVAGKWRAGQRIVHAMFGAGRIERVEGGGPATKLHVTFDDRRGTTTLLLKFAAKDLKPADP